MVVTGWELDCGHRNPTIPSMRGRGRLERLRTRLIQRDNDAVSTGRAEHLATAEKGHALHVLAAVNAGEFEISLHAMFFRFRSGFPIRVLVASVR